MSIVSFEVDGMTDYQILFSAHVFKNLNTAPDVNWEEVGKALSVEPEFAKKYCENICKLIKMKVARNERKEKKGEVVNHKHSQCIVDALAPEQGNVDCNCDQHAEVWKAGKTDFKLAEDEYLNDLKTLEKEAKKAAAKGLVNTNGVVDIQKLDNGIGE